MKSMTGYGEHSLQQGAANIRVEVKTLNNRYSDISVKIPKDYMGLEPAVLKEVKEHFNRGKVDVFIDIQEPRDKQTATCWNKSALENTLALIAEASNIAKQNHPNLAQSPFNLANLLSQPGLLTEASNGGQETSKTLTEALLKAVREAAKLAFAVRRTEGIALRNDLELLRKEMEASVGFFRSHLDDLRKEINQRYLERLESVKTSIEDNPASLQLPSADRLMQEVIVLVDKADIQEEVSRLEAHCQQFGKFLDSSLPVGRKMDFLCQELGREANTILSKAYKAEYKEKGVELKHTIEKIRQQVQNIE